MIIDAETNRVYLADVLAKQNPGFFHDFTKVLDDCKIEHIQIPGTKDIWAVDYMPIQIDEKNFIHFKYNPDYLQSKKWTKTISDVNAICTEIGINIRSSNIVLDGGNVIRSFDKVILCDKIFLENPDYTSKRLIKELQDLFGVDQIYFIPQQPGDYTGHADGMIRFLDNNTVIINDYKNENSSFVRAFHIALHNAGLDYIKIPHNPNTNSNYATGYYINYLQMQDTVIIPIFGTDEDGCAVKEFEQIFPNQKIAVVESNEIAKLGGVLNCITWNIKV